MDDLGEIGTAWFIFKLILYMIVLGMIKMILCMIVSAMNVNLPCCSYTLQAPKKFILHLLTLVGDTRVPDVEAGQDEVILAGIAIKGAQ